MTAPHSKPKIPLGEWLCRTRQITPEQLDIALETLNATPASKRPPLGEYLLEKRQVSPLGLYHTLAAQLTGQPLLMTSDLPAREDLLQVRDITDYMQHRYLPWQRQPDGAFLIATPSPSVALQRWCEARYGRGIRFAFISPRDLRLCLEQQFSAACLHHATQQLKQKNPIYSAFFRLSKSQRAFMAMLLLGLLAACIFSPQSILIATLICMNMLYATTLGFKLLLLCVGQRHKPQAPAIAMDDATLPTYSILIPMYREAASVPRLLEAMRSIDYPRDKLDIKLVIEADDDETWQAIQSARPESHFDIIRVPPSNPRTKPKACNYALHFVRGDYVTIYDAEDHPDPLQLRKAVAAFRAAPADVVCLQARLNYYNAHENMLTRCFALEYANLFDIALPALQRLGIPIPLGGTSNHLRVSALRELQAWDPYNVTEDADLGIRLAMRGKRTQMLESVTLEEATPQLRLWFNQRSRWIKGYAHTWLITMRRPIHCLRTLGWRAFAGFHLMIGLPCLVFLLAPFWWVGSLLWVSGLIQLPALPASLMQLSLAIFAFGFMLHLASGLLCMKRWRNMRLAVTLFPFYWFLHSFASFKALWQLIRRPHYWEKTPHGVSAVRPEAALR
jgi:glycosyltransferase XagB